MWCTRSVLVLLSESFNVEVVANGNSGCVPIGLGGERNMADVGVGIGVELDG